MTIQAQLEHIKLTPDEWTTVVTALSLAHSFGHLQVAWLNKHEDFSVADRTQYRINQMPQLETRLRSLLKEKPQCTTQK